MQEKCLWQHINDRVRCRIKNPCVIVEKDPMKHHEEAIKIHCHQKRDHNRYNNRNAEWLDQLPQTLLFH